MAQAPQGRGPRESQGRGRSRGPREDRGEQQEFVEKLVGINRDVTDEREAELRLRASEEQYRSLFETMEEGFGIGELVRFVQDNEAEFRSRPKDDFFRLAQLRRQMSEGVLDGRLRRTYNAGEAKLNA